MASFFLLDGIFNKFSVLAWTLFFLPCYYSVYIVDTTFISRYMFIA